MSKNSQSIDESIEHKVFQYKLYPDNSIIKIGPVSTDTIKEAWKEYGWMYSSSGEIVKDSSTQTLILLSNTSKSPLSHILLKHGGSYFGWNRVLFGNYGDDQPIFVVSDTDKEKNIDTIYLRKHEY
jgi:hypothetical protein